MISPINANWYQDLNWTANLAPNVQTAQINYNTALAVVTADQSDYTTAQSALSNALNQPIIVAPVVQQRLSTFKSAASTYEAALQSFLPTAQALLEAQSTETTYMSQLADTQFTSYVNTLANEIGTSTTLSGPVMNTLPQELTDANTQRETDLTDFNTKYTAFLNAQFTVSQDRVNVLIDQDSLLSAQAQLAIDQNSVPPASPSTIQQDQTTVNTLKSQLSTDQTTLTTDLATRDSAQTALNTSITTYLNDTNSLVSVMAQGATLVNDTAMQDNIAALQAQAQTMFTQALSNAQAADTANLTEHNTEFPTTSSALLTQLTTQEEAAIANIAETLSSGLDTVPNVTGSVTLPQLPTGGKDMSMLDLMRFIGGMQLLIGRLESELQQSDRNIAQMRLQIWSFQIGLLTGNNALLALYAQALTQADTTYQLQVAQANIDNSTAAVDQINNLKNHLSAINQIIENFNTQVSAQNNRAQDVVTALNNSNIIATDVTNQTNPSIPQAVNEENVLGDDTTLSTPPTVPTPVTVPLPPTIEQLPTLSASDFTIPSSFPITPADPTQPLSASNLPTNLPSASDISTLNNEINTINTTLFPIQNLVNTSPIDYTFIEPFVLQTPLTKIRTLSDVTNLTVAITVVNTIFATVLVMEAQQKERQKHEVIGKFQQATTLNVLDPQPTTQNQFSTAAPVGGGAGLLSAETLGSQTKVGQAVSQVVTSGEILDTIQKLTEQSALKGGLIGSTLPTKFPDYTELGLVRTQTSDLQVQTVANRQQIAATQAAQSATVKSIIQTATNSPLLQQEALNLYTQVSQGSSSLSSNELQQVIAQLEAILSTLLLLVAALLQAAGGGNTNLDSVVAQLGLRQQDDLQFAQAAANLQKAGVSVPAGVTPSTPGFEETILNHLVPVQPVATQPVKPQPVAAQPIATQPVAAQPLGTQPVQRRPVKPQPVVAQPIPTQPIKPQPVAAQPVPTQPVKPQPAATQPVVTPTTPQPPPTTPPPAPPLTTPTAVLPLPLQSQVALTNQVQNVIRKNGLTLEPTLPLGTAVTQALSTASLDTRASVRQGILNSVVAQANTLHAQTPPTTLAEKVTKVAGPQLAQVPPQLVASITNQLNRTAPPVPGLSTNDRNTIAIATATKAITPEQASALVNQQLFEEARSERPLIAEAPQIPIQKKAKQVKEVKTEQVTTGETQTDTENITALKNAFKQLSQQAGDQHFVNEIVLLTADNVRNQTSFFKRSVDLILDPARFMVRNFSIFTQGTDRGPGQTPLSIPISG